MVPSSQNVPHSRRKVHILTSVYIKDNLNMSVGVYIQEGRAGFLSEMWIPHMVTERCLGDTGVSDYVLFWIFQWKPHMYTVQVCVHVCVCFMCSYKEHGCEGRTSAWRFQHRSVDEISFHRNFSVEQSHIATIVKATGQIKSLTQENVPQLRNLFIR